MTVFSPPKTADLAYVLDQFERCQVLIPEWQRDYCWDERKATKFLQRCLIDECLLSPIHYVRIGNDGPLMLLDGRQRIDTLRFRKHDPKSVNVTEDEVQRLRQRTSVVTCEHRVKTEHDAIQLFRDINQSTALISYELFRPILDCAENIDRRWYAGLRDSMLDVCRSHCGLPVSTFNSRHRDNRKQVGQFHRNGLGLFYKWASKHTRQSLFNSMDNCNEEDLIENQVLCYLEKLHPSQRSRKRSDFIVAFESACVDVREVSGASKLKKPITTPLIFLSLVALKFHLLANGFTVADWHRVLEWYGGQMKNRRDGYTARFEVETEDNTISIRFSGTNLSGLISSLAAIDPVDMNFSARKTRSKQTQRSVGFDDGHPDDMPFATHGDQGVNVPELSSKNRGKRNG